MDQIHKILKLVDPYKPSANVKGKLKYTSDKKKAALKAKTGKKNPSDMEVGHYASRSLRRKAVAQDKKLKEEYVSLINSIKEAYELKLITEEVFVTLLTPVIEGSLGQQKVSRLMKSANKKLVAEKPKKGTHVADYLRKARKYHTKKALRSANASIKAHDEEESGRANSQHGKY